MNPIETIVPPPPAMPFRVEDRPFGLDGRLHACKIRPDGFGDLLNDEEKAVVAYVRHLEAENAALKGDVAGLAADVAGLKAEVAEVKAVIEAVRSAGATAPPASDDTDEHPAMAAPDPANPFPPEEGEEFHPAPAPKPKRKR